MRSFIFLVTTLSTLVLLYVYTFPPKSTRVSKDGVPFFTPYVTHPETGEALDVNI